MLLHSSNQRGKEILIWVMEFVEKEREARGELEDEQMLAAEALARLSRYSSVSREGEPRPSLQILAESQVFFKYIRCCVSLPSISFLVGKVLLVFKRVLLFIDHRAVLL